MRLSQVPRIGIGHDWLAHQRQKLAAMSSARKAVKAKHPNEAGYARAALAREARENRRDLIRHLYFVENFKQVDIARILGIGQGAVSRFVSE